MRSSSLIAIEPNDNPEKYAIPRAFAFRETYWEWGGTTNPQSGDLLLASYASEAIMSNALLWVDGTLFRNDPYGRSVGMEASRTSSNSSKKPDAKPKASTKSSTRP